MKPETRQATREYFRDNALACIAEVDNGTVVLPSHTSRDSYAAWCNERAAAAMAGEYDSSFTFLQRAHWIETGVCVALLP